MEETIQAAEITILTVNHVTVATACNKVTIHGISTTVLKKLSGTQEECTLHQKITLWTSCVAYKFPTNTYDHRLQYELLCTLIYYIIYLTADGMSVTWWQWLLCMYINIK
jgi:hypothetical protein